MAKSTLLSRRGFLAASSATALALGNAAHARPLLRLVPRHEPTPAAWAELASKMRVVRPGHPDYLKLALPDNLVYEANLPAGIARCENTEDVATAIRWSRENAIPLITRSGGHSYAGYSTTRGLMIDMRLMNDVRFDAATGIVTVAGGAVNDRVYDALARANATLTHGRCPSVGAAAFLLGGGIGFDMRQYGLACDQVAETELVKADGGVLSMSPTQNVLPFWACRGGGGGNFGISTSFSIKTAPAPDMVTVFEMIWETADHNVALALMEALAAGPDTLGSRVSIVSVNPKRDSPYKGIKIDLLGQLKGSKAELAALLKQVPPPTESTVEELPYWKGQDFLAEPAAPTYYQERSAFVKTPVPTGPLLTGFKEFLNRWPGVAGNCDLRFFQTGKAVNALKPEDTAFVHRSSEWLMVVGLYWTAWDNFNPAIMERAHRWQDDFYRAVLPFSQGGAYQNFPDPSLADWREAYYGGNLDALVAVKNTLDPAKVFNFPQAISAA
ncbi:MAG TPA: FAD-binding oxidoreductase [Rhizomicrobium sp.]|jgi:FAD/FMN-containing dehydrogenase|nr:FAD-binding oxidoreductase [Rhizomicrobium sp.]